MSSLPTFDDILRASETLAGFAVRTPLIESPVLNERTGARVLLKFEGLQRTGSFKFRGAYNRVSRVNKEAFPGGVVACSSGNHAQGVAAAARLFGHQAAIVMPADAPRIKRERTEALGAKVVPFDRMTENREEIVEHLAGERHADVIPPYDDPFIIAGQGTGGLELAEQAEAVGAEIDIVLVPVGGGGLSAGVGLAISKLRPDAKIYGVEPAGFDDYGRSLTSGERQRNASAGGSICDALLAPEPGEMTFAINRNQLKGALAVDDDAVRRAIAYAFTELKLVVEPGGVVGLAALLENMFPARGKTIAIVLSGANVDPDLHAEILTSVAGR